MKILYASARPPYPFFLGGAARCAHMLLHALSINKKAECVSIGCGNYAVTPWNYPEPSEYSELGIIANHNGVLECGYPVQILPDFSRPLSDFIDDFKPDVIWSQLEGALPVLELAALKNIQGLYYVHDAEFDPNELRKIADLGCHIVCSSQFLAEKAKSVIGRTTHKVYPAAELYFGARGNPDGFITMINPHRVKGLETFLEIARRMPDQQFLLLESWKLNEQAITELLARLSEIPNIQFLHRVSDMRSVYEQTKLLLIPSIWEEGFGMVAVESQSCRIPVIASERGGLPESVGTGGILIKDYLNVEKWLDAIKHIMTSTANYQTLADKAYQHANLADFSSSWLADQFLEICTSKKPSMDPIHRCIYAVKRKLNAFL